MSVTTKEDRMKLHRMFAWLFVISMVLAACAGAPTATATEPAAPPPTPTATEPAEPAPTEPPATPSTNFYSYRTDVSVLDDPSGHEKFIKLVGKGQFVKVVLEGESLADGGLITIYFNDWVLHGWVDKSGRFEATGEGTAAGFGGIDLKMQGDITFDGIDAVLTIGGKGGLPGGKAVMYDVVSSQ